MPAAPHSPVPPPPLRRSRVPLRAALLAVLAALPPLAARPPELAVALIEGRPCVRCAVRVGGAGIPANVVLDLGQPAPLVLHERTAALLNVPAGGAVTLEFNGLKLPDLPARIAQLRSLEALTRDHAVELGELPAVAIVGLPAFAGGRPELDLAAGRLRVLPPAPETADAAPPTGASPSDPAATAPSTDAARTILPLEERPTGYWLGGVGPDDFPLRVRLSTVQHDTLIDADVAVVLDAPAGNVASLHLGSVDISRYVALRPEDLAALPGHPHIMLGTGLLAHFRLLIDPQRHLVELEPVQAPRFPQDDQDFFAARESGDPDRIESWLAAHPAARLAREAAELLLEARLAPAARDPDAVARALRLRAQATAPERRAALLVQTADALLASDRPDAAALATVALQLAQESAPADLAGRAAHDIQARLGLVALRRDDLPAARRHLLSAAFGLPRDPLVSLWLGQVYERMGRPARAWSRYAQALVADASLVDAQRGLDRLNHDPAFRATFSMADAQQLLEGRVPEFHPPERHRRTNPDEAPTVRLVELFSCVDNARTAAAELAFGGLAEYFEGTAVVFIEYHLSLPRPDPLAGEPGAARAAFYEIAATPAARFDGQRAIDTGGGERDAAAVYEEYRLACELLPPVPPAWRLGGAIRRDGGELAVEITLDGPEAGPDLRLLAVLCEHRVMLPGASGVVLHRHVARHALAPPDGFSVPAAPGPRTFAARLAPAQLAQTLADRLARLEQEHGVTFHMRPTYVDPDECLVALILQDSRTRAVLAAATLPVPAAPEATP